MSGPSSEPGSPRSERAADQLARFEQAMQLPLVLAAMLPLLLWLGHHRSFPQVPETTTTVPAPVLPAIPPPRPGRPKVVSKAPAPTSQVVFTVNDGY